MEISKNKQQSIPNKVYNITVKGKFLQGRLKFHWKQPVRKTKVRKEEHGNKVDNGTFEETKEMEKFAC